MKKVNTTLAFEGTIDDIKSQMIDALRDMGVSLDAPHHGSPFKPQQPFQGMQMPPQGMYPQQPFLATPPWRQQDWRGVQPPMGYSGPVGTQMPGFIPPHQFKFPLQMTDGLRTGFKQQASNVKKLMFQINSEWFDTATPEEIVEFAQSWFSPSNNNPSPVGFRDFTANFIEKKNAGKAAQQTDKGSAPIDYGLTVNLPEEYDPSVTVGVLRINGLHNDAGYIFSTEKMVDGELRKELYLSDGPEKDGLFLWAKG